MMICLLKKEEYLKTRALYEEVFSEDSKGFVDYYYSEKTKDNQIYVVEEDGQIQSMLHLNPYKVMVNGEVEDLNYIVAVATRAAYRGRGYMRQLLMKAMRDMYESGQSFTFLMPAAEAIYSPYGFRTVYQQDGRIYDEMGVSNEALMERYQIFSWRSDAYYDRLKKEFECEVHEGEDNFVPMKIMTRVLDMRRLVGHMDCSEPVDITIQLQDPIIGENSGCFRLCGEKDAKLSVTEGSVEDSVGIFSIEVFGEWIFGMRKIEELSGCVPLSRIHLNEIV